MCSCSVRSAIRLAILLSLACCLDLTSCEEQLSEDEIYSDMFQMLDEKSELENELKKLIGDIATHPGYKKPGDLSHCPKTNCTDKAVKKKKKKATEFESQFIASMTSTRPRKANSARFMGKFPFRTRKLHSIDAKDPRLLKLLKEGRPVIIKNSRLVQSAVDRWDLNFIVSNVGGSQRVTLSDSRQFLFHQKIEDPEMLQFEWEPPFKGYKGVIADFVDLVEKLEEKRNGSYSYLQVGMDDIQQGPDIRADYERFNWKWLDGIKPDHWGALQQNLFILGMPNVVTPAHYDGLQNLFTQIRGFKRCILFPPDHYGRLYIHPEGHPSSRQTQVNFDKPNLSLFPRIKDSEGLEAVVGPGDVLYIPAYWFHHIESEKDSMTLSMNFWFTGANSSSSTEQSVTPPQRGERGAASQGADSDLDGDEEDEDEDFKAAARDLQTGYHPDLPSSTYMLRAIKEIRLINIIENALGGLIGVDRVSEFLDKAFSGRYDLIKYKSTKGLLRSHKRPSEKPRPKANEKEKPRRSTAKAMPETRKEQTDETVPVQQKTFSGKEPPKQVSVKEVTKPVPEDNLLDGEEFDNEADETDPRKEQTHEAVSAPPERIPEEEPTKKASVKESIKPVIEDDLLEGEEFDDETDEPDPRREQIHDTLSSQPESIPEEEPTKKASVKESTKPVIEDDLLDGEEFDDETDEPGM